MAGRSRRSWGGSESGASRCSACPRPTRERPCASSRAAATPASGSPRASAARRSSRTRRCSSARTSRRSGRPRHRQHLCPRPDGDGQRRARPSPRRIPAGSSWASASATRPSVTTRGGDYGKPIETMRTYLDAMAAAQYAGPEPDRARPAGARGARAEDAGARRRAGRRRPPLLRAGRAHADARAALRAGALLAVEQTAVLATDPIDGRADRPRVREALPRAAELRQQPAPARLVGRRHRERRQRPADRRGDRLGRCRRDRRAGQGAPRRGRRSRLRPAPRRVVGRPGARRATRSSPRVCSRSRPPPSGATSIAAPDSRRDGLPSARARSPASG